MKRRVFQGGAAVALLVVLQLLPGAPNAEAQTAPTDELRLHDGGFLRGTIVELTATELTFQLVTGEVRTYSMSEVESVGQAERPRPAAQAPMEPSTINLRVEAEQRELSLHRLTNSTTVSVSTYSNGQTSYGTAVVDQYAPICNAPCNVDIPPGTFVLGVAQGSGRPQRIGRPTTLDRDSHLAIAYDDRSVLRGMGWLAFALGNAGGLALFFPALLAEPSFDVSLLVGASVVFGVGYIVFFALAFFNDAPLVDVLSPEGVRF